METATRLSPLIIAVVDHHLAEVSFIARVLQAHGLPDVLQVLESRQRTMHFFAQLAAQDAGRGPDLLLLDFTLPGLDTRALLPWIKALPVCRRGRMVAMTGADDLSVETEARALGADAFVQKPVSFQRFLAGGDLIKALVFGHTQA